MYIIIYCTNIVGAFTKPIENKINELFEDTFYI